MKIDTLTPEEETLLVRLLRTMRWPVSLAVFEAFCETQVIIALELVVLKKTDAGVEVLLIERKDKYFDAWHLPGMIMYPGVTAENGLPQLVAREVGALSDTPRMLAVIDVLKGGRYGESARGQELARLYTVWVKEGDEIQLGKEKKFFPLNSPEVPIITQHQKYLDVVREFLKTSPKDSF